jgi:hypothetical protein
MFAEGRGGQVVWFGVDKTTDSPIAGRATPPTAVGNLRSLCVRQAHGLVAQTHQHVYPQRLK